MVGRTRLAICRESLHWKPKRIAFRGALQAGADKAQGPAGRGPAGVLRGRDRAIQGFLIPAKRRGCL